MKLYLCDFKHKSINGEIDLGILLQYEIDRIEEIISFLEDAGITDNKYKQLVLAENVKIEYDEDNFLDFIIEY